jgi:hypothetical protein
MQTLGNILLLIFVGCYVSTICAKSNTVADTVIDGATHIKDTVSDGVKTGAKVAADVAKHAG